MKQCLYCVEDKLGKQFMPPFCSPNDDTAKRDFIVGALMSETPIPDLNLWKVGEFVAEVGLDSDPVFQLRELPRTCISPTLGEIAEYKEYLDSFKQADEPKELA